MSIVRCSCGLTWVTGFGPIICICGKHVSQVQDGDDELFLEEAIDTCVGCPTSTKTRVRRVMSKIMSGDWRCIKNSEEFFTNSKKRLVVYRNPSKKLYGVYDPVNEDYEEFCRARYSYMNASQKRYQKNKKIETADDPINEDALGDSLIEKVVKEKVNDKDPAA